MSFGIKDDIIRFEISEDNHIFMQSLEGKNKFTDIFSSLFFRNDSSFADKFAKITTWVIVHDKEKFCVGLEGKVEFDHKGMIDDTHNIAFGQCISFEIFGHDLILT